jgi:beta-galactosidase
MKTFLIVGMMILGGAASALAAEGDAAGRQRTLWDFQWQFHRGDAPGAEQPQFDAAAWRAVDLPHDWSIERVPGSESLFDQQCPSGGGGGFLPGGVGWYRKTFTLPSAAKGRRVSVEFEGVYMDSDVWLNGRHLGNHPYGYTSFAYELTPYLKWDGPNLLAVRARVEQPCSRWYSGAGIYRHVWLEITHPLHVAPWGTYVTTPKITDAAATVRVRTRAANQLDAPHDVVLRTRILDRENHELAQAGTRHELPAAGEQTFDQSLTLPTPHRWSLTDPYLYTVVSEVIDGGGVVDAYRTPLGIRSIQFTRDRGLLLNGRHVPVQGVCNHHDQGYLGAAAYDRAIQRQLEILKQMGGNAVRTSHNPPAPKLLELCDRLGLLVMDEAFDEWQKNKTQYGYGRFFPQWSDTDLRSMLRRDRNHPCVVLWSIGNEIPEQGDAREGRRQARRLADICHEEDPTRPVTSACNNSTGAVRSGYADALDVLGINYSINQYDTWKGQRPLIGSETSSTVSTRGEYNLVLNDGRVVIEPRRNTQCTAYDIYRPSWAILAELQLKLIKDCPWMTGEFVWTGSDYIGEPTPFPWPAATSYFGIVDLCGFPKDRFYLYQSQWTDKPLVHILPHWNWAGWEGKAIPVWCYSNAQTVELFLNGKSLGRQTMGEGQLQKFVIDQWVDRKTKKLHPTEVETGWLHVAWDVPYRAGVLKAVARRGGQVVATDERATAGPPARLALDVDRRRIAADGQDLAFVTVRVQDAQGKLCPGADSDVLARFDLSGPGTLAAVGNGDPTSHADFQAPACKTFHGLCLAIVKAGRGAGLIQLSATAAGLKREKLEIRSEK